MGLTSSSTIAAGSEISWASVDSGGRRSAAAAGVSPSAVVPRRSSTSSPSSSCQAGMATASRRGRRARPAADRSPLAMASAAPVFTAPVALRAACAGVDSTDSAAPAPDAASDTAALWRLVSRATATASSTKQTWPASKHRMSASHGTSSASVSATPQSAASSAALSAVTAATAAPSAWRRRRPVAAPSAPSIRSSAPARCASSGSTPATTTRSPASRARPTRARTTAGTDREMPTTAAGAPSRVNRRRASPAVSRRPRRRSSGGRVRGSTCSTGPSHHGPARATACGACGVNSAAACRRTSVGSAPGRLTTWSTSSAPSPNRSPPMTRVSRRSSRRRTPLSRQSTPRRASSWPSRAAKRSRPAEAALGVSESIVAIPRRMLRKARDVAASADTDAMPIRSAWVSTGPGGSGRGRAPMPATGGVVAGGAVRPRAQVSHRLRRAASSPSRASRWPMSTATPSGPCAKPWTSALATASAASVGTDPMIASAASWSRGWLWTTGTRPATSIGRRGRRASRPATAMPIAAASATAATPSRTNGSRSAGWSGRRGSGLSVTPVLDSASSTASTRVPSSTC